MSEYSDKGPLAARLWLTGLVFCQIFLTPMAAFSITYLLEFEMASENFTMSFQSEMIPWIVSASLAYGMIALLLALIFGGFTPVWIVEKGGWKAAFGLTRAKRDAATLRNSRRTHANSPHAKLTVMVSDRIQKAFSTIDPWRISTTRYTLSVVVGCHTTRICYFHSRGLDPNKQAP